MQEQTPLNRFKTISYVHKLMVLHFSVLENVSKTLNHMLLIRVDIEDYLHRLHHEGLLIPVLMSPEKTMFLRVQDVKNLNSGKLVPSTRLGFEAKSLLPDTKDEQFRRELIFMNHPYYTVMRWTFHVKLQKVVYLVYEVVDGKIISGEDEVDVSITHFYFEFEKKMNEFLQ